jgi:hypothetical protein
MPRKKSDKAILADIREVIKDMDRHFRIKNYGGEGDDQLREDLAVVIIRDLANGTEDPLTRDYRRTKAERAAATPAP